jgi:predicted NBD/HSP70 family sugar kinase
VELTPRIKRRISKDYAPEDQQTVEELLLDVMSDLTKRGYEESERILAGVVLFGAGDVDRLLSAAQLALIDWRDVLMASGLEHGDWPERLDSEFGTDS